MKRTILALAIFIGLSLGLRAQNNNQPIVQTESPKGWIIKTKSSAYQLIVTAGGSVKPGYYGDKDQAAYGKKNAAWFEGIDEVPVRGGLPFKTPALEVVFADHVRDADLEYVDGKILTIDGRQTLKITQKDRIYPLQVISYIRVLPEYDILEKWIEVKNTSKTDKIQVENLMSGSIVLPADEYMLTQLSGTQLNEFQPIESLLAPGLKVIQNKAFKSNLNAPWFEVRPKSSSKDAKGPTWFGALHYSGNWQLVFDKAFNANVQILGGINFWDTQLNLKPGQDFQTPKLSVGYTPDGSEGVSQNLGAYVREQILPAEHRTDMRPVLFNSWYATTYNLNEDQQIEMAKIAAKMGVELFVVDDGWYKGRTGSAFGLGDWEPDKTKFPNGLGSMIKRVNDLGMKFGIWIEPESVNINSEVYKARPDWILSFPGRRKTLPYRVFLNLAKEEVYQHLLTVMTKLLQENKIDFVKVDQNTFLSEPGWADAPAEDQREVRIRYIQNLYRLFDELKKRFPKVWFESCASGGGRIDYGMLSRMDQTWVSDNSTAADRLFIQYGFLNVLPANTMVSWVIEQIGNDWSQPTSLGYRFDVAMSGVLGIGYDIRKWTPAEMEIAKNKIELYKKIRPIIQQGVLHRLVSPFTSNRCALQYNAADRQSSVVFCYNLAVYLPGSQLIDRGSSVLKLEGLNPDQSYIVKKAGDVNDKGMIYKGDFLMNVGITWPPKKSYESEILLIDKAN
jgi:alpha-galactosidase